MSTKKFDTKLVVLWQVGKAKSLDNSAELVKLGGISSLPFLNKGDNSGGGVKESLLVESDNRKGGGLLVAIGALEPEGLEGREEVRVLSNPKGNTRTFMGIRRWGGMPHP